MHNLHFIEGEHVHQGYLFYNFLQSLITFKFEHHIYLLHKDTGLSMEGIIEQAEFITRIYSHCWFVSVFRQVGTLHVFQS